jgi:hypothetical protein
MASTSISIKYRPVRIGFLVRDGSIEDLVKAAGLNTLLWSGVYNPIIPVKAGDDSFPEQLIKLFSVDVLYPVFKSDEINTLMKKHPFLQAPGHYAEDLYYEEGWHEKKKIMAFLDTKRIVDYLWEKEFKQSPKEYKSAFTLMKWEDSDPLNNLLSLQFGYFPKIPGVDFKYNYENIFVNGLRSDKRSIENGKEIIFSPQKEWSQIDSTGFELAGYSTGSRSNDHGFYAGISDNFEDLITFWNLRASGIHLVFFPKDHPDRAFNFVQQHLKVLDESPNRHHNFNDYLGMYHKIEDNEEVKSLVAKFTTTKKRIGINNVSEHSWNGLNIQPYNYVFKWKRATADIDKPDERYIATIRLPEKHFIVDDDTEGHSQHLAINIDVYSDYGYPGHTLKVPYIKELEEFYSREISFDPWALRVEREGITIIDKVNDDSINLYPIPYQALVEKIFEFCGLKAKTSQPGLLARKVLEKIGGIEGGRFLKIKGVRKLLQENGSDKLITRGEATKTIFDNNFDKHKKLYIESRDNLELTPTQVFEYMLKNDFFRAGLELQCESCNLWSWLSLKNLDDQWHCEYCGAQNKTTTQLKNRGDWKFRKSGLFAKDNNQEGAIPVVLTLLSLVRILDHSNFIYSTALKLDGDGVNCETDLAILQYKYLRSDGIEVAIGECKSQGGSINQEDCDKLESAYNKIISKKIKCYLIFSKTADDFTPEEIELFKKLRAKDIPLILFTNKEMELYHPYWQEGGEIDPDIVQKYAHSLWELHLNSIARYIEKRKTGDGIPEEKN